MNIAKFCIRHKVTTLLAVIMIAVFGVVYTTQLQMALLPNIEYPAAYVYCYYNGAGPEDIEQLVTRPLESAIMSVPGVDSVTSSSADSISTIQIMYVENTDVDIAATKLREKFDALSLPDGCGSPVILNINVSEMMPSAIVGLLGDDLAALQQQAENVVAPALERIDGVASVSVSGGVERQITVTLDAQRAAGYGLSTSYITQILQAENLLYPAGEVYNGSQKLSVTTDAQLSTVDEVANINIPLQTGGTVRLGEVADVAFETSDRDAIAAMDGTPGIILQVSKRSGANEVKTAEAVAAAMEEPGGEGRLHPLRHPLRRERVHQRRRRRRARGHHPRRRACGARGVAVPAPRRRDHDHRGLHARVHPRGVRADVRLRPDAQHDEPRRHRHGRRHDRG